jgi:hypothetical protein
MIEIILGHCCVFKKIMITHMSERNLVKHVFRVLAFSRMQKHEIQITAPSVTAISATATR